MSGEEKKQTSVVTTGLLRHESGQFDVAAGILQIELCGRGFQDISVLGQCVALLRLDLSNNLISSISVLASLTNLQYLNVARNKLESIDGVESMEEVRYLNAAGNNLMSFTALEPLRGKQKLRTIILEEKSQDLTNPVCQLPGYRTEVLKLVPHLTVLDGEHINGSAKELFDLFRELDSKLPGAADVHCSAVSQPEPFLHNGFWDKKSNSMTDPDDNEIDRERQQFEALAKECKKLDDEAAELILKLQNDDKGSSK